MDNMIIKNYLSLTFNFNCQTVVFEGKYWLNGTGTVFIPNVASTNEYMRIPVQNMIIEIFLLSHIQV